MGLDWKVDEGLLARAGYEKTVACDFDQRLPLEDESADIVVSLHVFEHVPRPGFTLGEIRRILRPGGILLAGSPSAPDWVAPIVERRFTREMKDALRRWGGTHSQPVAAALAPADGCRGNPSRIPDGLAPDAAEREPSGKLSTMDPVQPAMGSPFSFAGQRSLSSGPEVICGAEGRN